MKIMQVLIVAVCLIAVTSCLKVQHQTKYSIKASTYYPHIPQSITFQFDPNDPTIIHYHGCDTYELDALRRNSRGMVDYKNVGSLTDNGRNSTTKVPNIGTDQQILWHFVKLVKFVVKTNVGVDFNDFWGKNVYSLQEIK